MKSVFNKPVTTSSVSLLNASECKKDILPAKFYFEYKINGQEYICSSYSNCRIKLKDDTILFNATRDFETIEISIIKAGHIPVAIKRYKLNQDPRQRATYKNSSFVNDTYSTDSLHKGALEIISFDGIKKVISGTFSFQAYNAVRKKAINITDGRFCLQCFDNN